MLLTICFIIVSLLGLAMMAYLIHAIKGISEIIASIESYASTINTKLGTVNDEGKVLGLLNKAATHAKNCSTMLIDTNKTLKGLEMLEEPVKSLRAEAGEIKDAVANMNDREEWNNKLLGLGYPGIGENELHDQMTDGAKFAAQYLKAADDAYRDMRRADERPTPDTGTTEAIKDEPAEEEGATQGER